MFFGFSWLIPRERRECSIGSLHGLKRRGQNALWLLLADSEGEKRMLPGQIDEADILVGGESRRQGRMVMLKMQCTAKPVAPRCDG